MDAVLLSRFAPPGLTWPEILKLNGLGKKWWTQTIVAAEDNGHLAWTTRRGAKGRWVLTEEGRAWIASHAKGVA